MEVLSGLALSQRFFAALIEPAMARAFPSLPYAAALVGPGSDVQGFDTSISTDHDWGPRLTLFLPEGTDPDAVRPQLEAQLPERFLGWPVWYGTAGDGVSVSDLADQPSRHTLIRITTPMGWARDLLELTQLPPTTGQWLRMSEQQLLEATGGQVFRDDTGELGALRRTLAFYPDGVWRYRMLALWSEIGEENHFTGRTGDVGDDLGSRILAARQARRMIHLAFLLERRYAPYSKWLGTGFQRLPLYPQLGPALDALTSAGNWRDRVAAQGRALDVLLDAHDALSITPPVARLPAPYRPQYLTRDVAPVCQALRATLDETLGALPALGSVSDFLDNTPALCGSTANQLRTWLMLP